MGDTAAHPTASLLACLLALSAVIAVILSVSLWPASALPVIASPEPFSDQNVLPAPQNITLVSINMKHLVSWSPVASPGGNVTYSLQVQGEFEKTYWNGTWSDIVECFSVTVPQCDVTQEIAANVFYSLRVRAELGTERSAWGTLEHPFNRITTELTPPVLKVRAEGHHLIVMLEEIDSTFEFELGYWSTNNLSMVHTKIVKDSRTPVHLDTVEVGMEYCVKARTYVPAIHRFSNFSSPECTVVPDARDPVLIVGLLSLFGFILAIIVLPLLAWKAHQMLRYSCCPDVTMPQTLTLTDSPQKLIYPKSKAGEDSTEECAVVVKVIDSDELKHLWVQEKL